MSAKPIMIEIHMRPKISLWAAFKLRLAGAEAVRQTLEMACSAPGQQVHVLTRQERRRRLAGKS